MTDLHIILNNPDAIVCTYGYKMYAHEDEAKFHCAPFTVSILPCLFVVLEWPVCYNDFYIVPVGFTVPRFGFPELRDKLKSESYLKVENYSHTDSVIRIIQNESFDVVKCFFS